MAPGLAPSPQPLAVLTGRGLQLLWRVAGESFLGRAVTALRNPHWRRRDAETLPHGLREDIPERDQLQRITGVHEWDFQRPTAPLRRRGQLELGAPTLYRGLQCQPLGSIGIPPERFEEGFGSVLAERIPLAYGAAGAHGRSFPRPDDPRNHRQPPAARVPRPASRRARLRFVQLGAAGDVAAQRWVGVAEEASAAAALEGCEDAYGCPHYFVQRDGQLRPTPEHLQLLRACYLDLDTYRDPDLAGLEPEELARRVLEVLEAAGIPRPTIVFTGRGLQLVWWFAGGILPSALPRWKAVQTALDGLLRAFRPDPAVTLDPVRILRLPGSINRKSGRRAAVLVAGDVVTFDELAAAALPLARQTVRALELERRTAAPRSAPTPRQLATAREISAERAEAIPDDVAGDRRALGRWIAERARRGRRRPAEQLLAEASALLDHRGGLEPGRRDLVLFPLWCLRGSLAAGQEALRAAIVDDGRRWAAWSPLEALARAQAALRYHAEGRCRAPSAAALRALLAPTSAEVEVLGLLELDPDRDRARARRLERRRQAARLRAERRRRAQDRPTRAALRARRRSLASEALRRRRAGQSLRAIARAVGVPLATVARWLAAPPDRIRTGRPFQSGAQRNDGEALRGRLSASSGPLSSSSGPAHCGPPARWVRSSAAGRAEAVQACGKARLPAAFRRRQGDGRGGPGGSAPAEISPPPRPLAEACPPPPRRRPRRRARRPPDDP